MEQEKQTSLSSGRDWRNGNFNVKIKTLTTSRHETRRKYPPEYLGESTAATQALFSDTLWLAKHYPEERYVFMMCFISWYFPVSKWDDIKTSTFGSLLPFGLKQRMKKGWQADRAFIRESREWRNWPLSVDTCLVPSPWTYMDQWGESGVITCG